MVEKFEAAIEAIIEGAKLHHLGAFLERQKMQADGIRRTDDGMKVIDEQCPQARDILIPLLQSGDWGVRATVAGALVQSRPELALPVLEHIAANCPTVAQRSAISLLTFHDVFGPGVASLCRSDPRHPVPEKHAYKGEPLFPP